MGGDIHAADDRGLPDRRSVGRLPRRPLRSPPLHGGGNAVGGLLLYRSGDDPGGFQLPTLRGIDLHQRTRRWHLHRPEHRRDHEQCSGRPARRGLRRPRHLLQRRLVAVDRDLLLADDRRTRALPTRGDEPRTAAAGRSGSTGPPGGRHPAGRKPVRRLPGLQPDGRTAGPVQWAGTARSQRRGLDG